MPADPSNPAGQQWNADVDGVAPQFLTILQQQQQPIPQLTGGRAARGSGNATSGSSAGKLPLAVARALTAAVHNPMLLVVIPGLANYAQAAQSSSAAAAAAGAGPVMLVPDEQAALSLVSSAAPVSASEVRARDDQ